MDSDRKQFERWASDDWTSPNAVLKDADGIYKLMSVQQQWRAWQASAEIGTPHATWKLNNLHANYMAVRAECEALRADAERYRWLVANSFDKEGVTQMHCELHTWEPHSLTGLPTEWTQRVRGPAIDRFIDAAMAAMGKEKA